MTVRERLEEIDEDLLLADGFDDAIIGVGYRCAQPPVIIYDRQKCIEKLVAEGMEMADAEDHFEFNVAGAWVGERTPMFVARLEES
jgi:hypothetical protein